MAITIQGSGGGSDYKSTTYIVASPKVGRSVIAVGDWLIVCVAADADVACSGLLRDSTTVSVTLSAAATATSTGNVVTSILYGEITELPTGTDLITIEVHDLTGSEAKAASYYLVRGLASSPFDKSSTQTGTGTTPSSGATGTLSQSDEIGIGAIGMEHKSTESTGSWTTGASYVSGNELSYGTASNGSTANQVIRSAAEILSATTAQTAEVTGEGTSDWAACVATFKGAAAPVVFPPAPGRVHQDRRRQYIKM